MYCTVFFREIAREITVRHIKSNLPAVVVHLEGSTDLVSLHFDSPAQLFDFIDRLHKTALAAVSEYTPQQVAQDLAEGEASLSAFGAPGDAPSIVDRPATAPALLS